ncbi:DUF494 domain-containing protein [Alcaligenaceae bacterium 429]|uniref:DUF494 family protein n=1 Tax=Paenalcaligenes sp. Me52 TaxID=3392038 RepID=UPI001092B2A1|nr:DUF494 domain-containing protein [Alcaligenaceae bacterium 429]
MFDILVYLFENYYNPQACPKAEVLAHKLAAIGFEDDEINDALSWLHGLHESSAQHQPLQALHHQQSMRVYTDLEYEFLGQEALGFISFLEQSGALPPTLREIIIERAMAIDESPIALEKIKIITLIVLWSNDAEVEHLIFEELVTDDGDRLYH